MQRIRDGELSYDQAFATAPYASKRTKRMWARAEQAVKQAACTECDVSFPCFGGKDRCIRLPPLVSD